MKGKDASAQAPAQDPVFQEIEKYLASCDLPAARDRPNRAEWRAGDACPACGIGRLDYDGLLNLGCPECGFAIAGCFT